MYKSADLLKRPLGLNSILEAGFLKFKYALFKNPTSQYKLDRRPSLHSICRTLFCFYDVLAATLKMLTVVYTPIEYTRQ